MPIKLRVMKSGAEGESADYLFEQECITIGRGSENDLTLPDQKISKEHAEIRRQNGQYFLVDLGSKNYTYVLGEPISTEYPHELQSGDEFRLGDFKIEFVPLFMPSSEQTMYASADSFANAFEKHAAHFATALKHLVELYKYELPERRDEALLEAFNGRLDEEVCNSAHLAHILRSAGLNVNAGEDTEDALVAGDGAQGMAESAVEPSKPSVPAHIETVLTTLLETNAKLIGIPRRFWREFSGQTVVQPPQKDFLRGDADALRKHLMDPALSNGERRKRLLYLREAAGAVVTHQLAMLNGYRTCIGEGGKKLLNQVNPTHIGGGDGPGDGGVFKKFFASGGDGAASQADAVQELQEHWQKLHEGNWSRIEETFFRPAFIQAYLDLMATVWQDDEIVDPENNAEHAAFPTRY